jgi:hypothetical protein
MKRVIYVAGVNRKHLADAVDGCPYWLLSATLLRKYPSWLDNRLRNRKVIWDPGTFSQDAISYQGYLTFIDRYVKSGMPYLQYDEIRNPETTAFYLRDMRKRGYNPIPVFQPGGDESILQNELFVAIGALVGMDESTRMKYLDEILLDHKATAHVHFLGMRQHRWFKPYKQAISGDNTTWIPRSEANRRKTIEEWMKEYGEQWIPYEPKKEIQIVMGF